MLARVNTTFNLNETVKLKSRHVEQWKRTVPEQPRSQTF